MATKTREREEGQDPLGADQVQAKRAIKSIREEYFGTQKDMILMSTVAPLYVLAETAMLDKLESGAGKARMPRSELRKCANLRVIGNCLAEGLLKTLRQADIVCPDKLYDALYSKLPDSVEPLSFNHIASQALNSVAMDLMGNANLGERLGAADLELLNQPTISKVESENENVFPKPSALDAILTAIEVMKGFSVSETAKYSLYRACGINGVRETLGRMPAWKRRAKDFEKREAWLAGFEQCPVPAYLLNAFHDIVAWNSKFQPALGSDAPQFMPSLSLFEMAFGDPTVDRNLRLPKESRDLFAGYVVELYSEYYCESWWKGRIENACARYPYFADYWNSHEPKKIKLDGPSYRIMRDFKVEVFGQMVTFQVYSFRDESEDYWTVTYFPPEGSQAWNEVLGRIATDLP